MVLMRGFGDPNTIQYMQRGTGERIPEMSHGDGVKVKARNPLPNSNASVAAPTLHPLPSVCPLRGPDTINGGAPPKPMGMAMLIAQCIYLGVLFTDSSSNVMPNTRDIDFGTAATATRDLATLSTNADNAVGAQSR
jgi:hypothetical protein